MSNSVPTQPPPPPAPPPPPGQFPAPPSSGPGAGPIIALVLIVVVAIAAAVGGVLLVTRGSDEPAGPTTTATATTPGTTTPPGSSAPATEPPVTDPPVTEPSSPEFSIDGSDSTAGTVDGVSSNFHDVVVPDGVTALVTITPAADLDVDAAADGQTFNEAGTGEPEIVRVTGPESFTLEVYGFDGAAGDYTITVAEE